MIEAEQSKIDEHDLKIRSHIKALQSFISALNNRPAEAVLNAKKKKSSYTPSSLSFETAQCNINFFSGKYNKWLPFHYLFVSTVDNNRALSDILKRHYLNKSLKGEPARFSSHLPASNPSYQVAFFIFWERNGNKRIITHTHWDATFKFKRMAQESLEQLRKLVVIYVENTMTLQALGLDLESPDYM